MKTSKNKIFLPKYVFWKILEPFFGARIFKSKYFVEKNYFYYFSCKKPKKMYGKIGYPRLEAYI